MLYQYPSNDKEAPLGTDERATRWRNRLITPAQFMVHDVRLETRRSDQGPLLEVVEKSPWSLVPDSALFTSSESHLRASHATENPIDKQRFVELEEEYGWMRHLRLYSYQKNQPDDGDSAKCRWIHCSSLYPEYLQGFLWALSDGIRSVAASMKLLEHIIQRQTRFSKHGSYFAPFAETLLPHRPRDGEDVYPMLMAVPFLDWSILGPKPPLRFQIDKREGFRSSRSSVHLLRSILQYYYRLEDTTDRERSQVFAKHKPWNTDRIMDLRIRQWYGHYPSALNVDELWILAIDAEHIMTFSSNQTWKSRWPPLQLTSRISDVAFRGIRNAFFSSDDRREYTAMTHAIACLTGGVGLMHRNFWSDMRLCLADRYAGHLSQLQYRLHRTPSTKLVMDLIACQEELNIVIQITEQQCKMILGLESTMKNSPPNISGTITASPVEEVPPSSKINYYGGYDTTPLPSRRATYRQLSSSTLLDPMAQLIDNLQRELADLQDLRDNTDRLVTRTIQLVNIRLEDHGKAILVFTFVTIIFLPLNFVSSFFGMNVYDIRNMAQTQWLFWAVALCVTAGVVAASGLLAFSLGDILEKVHLWQDGRKRPTESQSPAFAAVQRPNTDNDNRSFRVWGLERST